MDTDASAEVAADAEQVLLFYCYEAVGAPGELAAAQRKLCERLALRGRVRVCGEGVNGTVGGPGSALREYCAETERMLGRQDIDWKWSAVQRQRPFDDLLVKEVADMVGCPSAGEYSAARTATHLSPEAFHAKLAEDVAVLDVRNTYEFQVGHFEGALDPGTRKYSEFEAWFRREGLQRVKGKSAVLMYCTGGIRCEKASIAVQEALEQAAQKVPVFQLKGGVHRYLEAFGPEESKFHGYNFVFDRRVLQPVPQADQRESVRRVGRCAYCAQMWDDLQDARRCHKCRMLVLACDQCAAPPHRLWCARHDYLDPRKTSRALIDKERKRLEAELDGATGRTKRRRRGVLTRQLAELQQAQDSIAEPAPSPTA